MLNIEVYVAESVDELKLSSALSTRLMAVTQIKHSPRFQAVIITGPCGDCVKRMSADYYRRTMATRSMDNGILDLTSMGAFLAVPAGMPVENFITANFNAFTETACSWDSFDGEESGGAYGWGLPSSSLRGMKLD